MSTWSSFTDQADITGDERPEREHPTPPTTSQCCCCELSATMLSLLMLVLQLYDTTQRKDHRRRYHGCVWSTWYEFSFQHKEFHKVFAYFSRMRPMNRQEREGGEQDSDWLQGIRSNENQRLWDVRKTINLYFTCSPEICHTYTRFKRNKRGGRDMKKNGHQVIGQTVWEC